jgi:hypothetical protein
MAQIPQTNVSMAAINTEVASVNSHSLTTLSTNGTVGGGTSTLNGSTPHSMGEFRGYLHVLPASATTYYASLSETEFQSDSNVIVRPQLRIMYLSGNINVYWYGDASSTSPSNGSLVYKITNPAAGYTVRETSSYTGDGPNNYSFSNLAANGSALSIPTSTFYQDWQPMFESGGDYDQAGNNETTLSGNLIFEKSGETTFTYSFSLAIDIETEGSGGE